VAEHIGALPSLQTVAHLLGGKVDGDEVRCPGPNHSKIDRSLSVKLDPGAPDGFLVYSFAQDDPIVCRDYVRQKLGLPAFKPNGGKGRFTEADIERAVFMAASRAPKAKIIDSYHYTDEKGVALYEVLRYEPKGFRQRRPDGKGGHVWNLDGVRRVPYRWPELAQYPSTTTYLTEGEKDCNRLWESGLVATSVQGGKWTGECVQALAGRQILILEDNDEAGRVKAQETARLLHGAADSVKVISLPSLPPRGDVSDWLDAGHTVDELSAFCNAVLDWEPEPSSASPSPSPPAPPSPPLVPVAISAPTAATIVPTTGPATLKASSITLSFFGDLVDAKPKPWLIKNVIARGECSSWIAPPGKGKSALLTDIFVHGANGVDWRGFRTRAKFGGIYFALERVDLVRRRMTAHRLRDDLPGNLPIAISGQVIDLMHRKCAANIVDAIKEAEDRFGFEVGLVTFDTWAKGIAAGGGDESSAKDQNIALANLRRVLDKANIHIATIGHTGKDESRGERGSNAKLADVDFQVQIAGDTIRSATVKKANDQPIGFLTSFRLESFDFGPDEDGDPFCTFIVSPEIISESAATDRPLSDQQQRAIEALAEATLAHGVDLPSRDGLPVGLKSVTADQWRAEVYRRGVLDQAAKNPRARFFELRNRLAAKHLIGVDGELVWLAIKGKQA
jgi:hypothetical protein